MRYKSGITAAILLSICSISLPLILPPQVGAAGSATLYFSPSAGSFQKNKTVTIKVYENSGSDTVNAVQANLMYSTTQFKYLSFTDSSAFAVEAQNPSGNTGSLHFARGTVQPVSGAQLVVTLHVMIVAGKGTIGISFASGSAVIRSADNKAEPLAVTNAAYSATTPQSSAAPAKSSPSPSSSPSSSSTASNAPAPAASVTFTPQPEPAKTPSGTTQHSSGITISDILSAAEAHSGTVFTWKTNVPATSTLSYGHDTAHMISTSDGRYVTNHRILLQNEMLQAGKTYYYYVTSTDMKGNKIRSQPLPFVAETNVAQTPDHSLSLSSVAGVLYGAIAVALCLAAVFAAVRIRRRVLQRQELKRHFPDLADPIVNNPTTPTVFDASHNTTGDAKKNTDANNDNKIG